MNKKAGDEKYYILISLIIGIMIMGIILFFIFKEYFDEDDLGWEACRQSIIIRASVPDYSLLDSSRDLISLKCKTQVYSINYKNLSKFNSDIQKLVLACDSLTGNGEYKIFPDAFFAGTDSRCFPCVRITFKNEEIRSFYKVKGRVQQDMIIFYHYVEAGRITGLSKLVLPESAENVFKKWYGQEGIDSFVSILDISQFSDLISQGCKLEGIPA